MDDYLSNPIDPEKITDLLERVSDYKTAAANA